MKPSRKIGLAWIAAAAIGLAACESYEAGTYEDNPGVDPLSEYLSGKKRQTIFGEGGISFFGDDEEQEGGAGIGVNVFLWRASIDTISFMPVNTADAFGGVIITDWHSTADAPNERFKLNVYILGRTLRADGVRVAVFRQVLTRNGQWLDSPVPEATKIKIEDAILTRARQMRNAALLQQKK